MTLSRLALAAVLAPMLFWIGAGDALAQERAAQSIVAGVGPQGAPYPPTAVYLTYNLYHADLILPRAALLAEPGAISQAVAASTDAPWVLIGWGDRKFGRHSKYAIVRLFNGFLTLLLPYNRSVVRVAGMQSPTVPVEDYVSVREIDISANGMDRMSHRIDRSINVGADGAPIVSHIRTMTGEAFYESKERYGLLHQCNHWIGQILRSGGAHTTPPLDVIPLFLMIDLRLHGHAGRRLPQDHVPPILRDGG